MNDAFSSFVIGFICTGALFALCFLVVVGFKVVILAIKDRFSKPKPIEQPAEQVKSPEPKKRKRKPKTTSKPIRSIEIDPDQIDRIYVKKIS